MKKLPFFSLFFIYFLIYPEIIQAQTPDKKNQATPEMKTYYFVMLKKGPKRDQDSTSAAKIQAGHMANMQKLADAKKLKVAGPFMDNGEWRGIFIFDAANLEEVKKMVDTDPAVIAGRLVYEIHPWMTQKGTCFD